MRELENLIDDSVGVKNTAIHEIIFKHVTFHIGQSRRCSLEANESNYTENICSANDIISKDLLPNSKIC